MATGKKDGVDGVFDAHLAFLLLLQDPPLLHCSSCSNPVLTAVATEHEHLLDYLAAQLGEVELPDKGSQVELRDDCDSVHLDNVLPANWTLCQLLSTLVASYKVTAVEDD